MAHAREVRLLAAVSVGTTLLLSACSESPIPAQARADGSSAEVGAPWDPDLKLGASCSGHAAAEKRAALLPTRVQELVVLWPRAGRRKVDGRCESITRMTVVNTTGQVVTLSFVLSADADAVPPDGFELLEDDPMPRTRHRLTQDGMGAGDADGSRWWVESEGSPTTSFETLEAVLGFFDLPVLMESLATGRAPAPESGG